MAASDQTYRNQRTLDIVFAVSRRDGGWAFAARLEPLEVEYEPGSEGAVQLRPAE